MKIVSKFKDYYDGCGYSTSAETGVYVRKTEEHSVSFINRCESVIRCHTSYRGWSATFGMIGFCGELYPYIKLVQQLPYKTIPVPDKVDFIWSFEEFEKIRNDPSFYEDSKNTNRKYYLTNRQMFISPWNDFDPAKAWYQKRFTDILDNTHKYHKSPNNRYIDPSKVFLDYKVPVFAIVPDNNRESCESLLRLNPCLKDYNFFQVFDAFTAYQKIEMYLNNQIVKPDDPYIVPVADDIKAQSHGFDKFSFRKEKTKKGK